MSTSTDRTAKPIFIIGTQRSGTTLLRLMLDSHENIAVGFESGFMLAVDHIKRLPGWNYGKNWYRRYGMDEEELNARIRDFYSGIFSDYAAANGKARWGEKTPNLAPMAEMARIFPDAQFVCIVRHAGAVASSLKRWNYTFERAIDYWVESNRRIKRLAPKLGTERVHVCRYEDLVSDPRAVLGDIMSFLDEPWSDDLLRHHEIQTARGTPSSVEGGTRVDRPVDAGAIDQWRGQLSDAELAALSDAPKRLLKHFGYRARTAVPASPLPNLFEDRRRNESDDADEVNRD